MKFWLTLITQERAKDIDLLTRDTFDFFDGIVAVVNQPSGDQTYDILDSRKKDGKIIRRPFVPHHAFLMNEFLFSGVIHNLDWFLIVDSSDRINLNWLKDLRSDIARFENEGIGGVFLDRIYLARYMDSMEFFGGVHWGLSPIFGKVLDLRSLPGYKKENYIVNTRDTLISGFLHPAKYWFQYGANSQTELLYRQFGEEIWRTHENLRMQFRIYCQNVLNINLTLDGLVNYLVENVGKYPDYFEQVLEFEVNLKDMFRLKVLKQPWQELAANRFNWSYFEYKRTGQISQDPKKTGYKGIFNVYRNQKGLEDE